MGVVAGAVIWAEVSPVSLVMADLLEDLQTLGWLERQISRSDEPLDAILLSMFFLSFLVPVTLGRVVFVSS